MLKSRRSSALEEAAVDMAPLIDMTFLLLIFFLVNTNFIKETGIEVKRPQAASGTEMKGDMILIGVSASGTVHMAGKRIDISGVRPNVASMLLKMPNAPVVVVADAATRTDACVSVIDECRLAGAKEVTLSTKSGGS